jgi:hypothetical protein
MSFLRRQESSLYKVKYKVDSHLHGNDRGIWNDRYIIYFKIIPLLVRVLSLTEISIVSDEIKSSLSSIFLIFSL